MILVDSNTWVDYFNGADAPHVKRLQAALDDEEDLGLIPLILTESSKASRPSAASGRLGACCSHCR